MSSKKFIAKSSLVIAIFLFLTACREDSVFRADYSLAEEMLFDTTGQERVETESGLVYYQISPGSGDLEVVIRDNILLYYTGRRASNDDIFESSYVNGNSQALQFDGIGSTSKGSGFIEGVVGMKVGEQRVLIIPPELSNYSETVIYDVEVDAILY